MEEVMARILGNLHGRMDGPMWFRFILPYLLIRGPVGRLTRLKQR